MNRINLQQLVDNETTTTQSPSGGLQAAIYGAEPGQGEEAIRRIVGTGPSNLVDVLVNARNTRRTKNQTVNTLSRPQQAGKDVHKEMAPNGMIVGDYVGEEIALSKSRQGVRMVPTMTFGN